MKKECPNIFCKEKNVMISADSYGYFVKCPECCMCGPRMPSEEEAIDRWNFIPRVGDCTIDQYKAGGVAVTIGD